MFSIKSAALAGAVAFALPLTANAAVITFGPDGWTNESGVTGSSSILYVVEIDDTTTAGAFHVQISEHDTSANTGDIRGIGFDTSLTGVSIGNFTSNTGDTIGALSFGSNLGGGLNFNGGGGAVDNYFDILTTVGVAGSASGLNTTLSFDVFYTGVASLDLTTFSQWGIRTQSVGSYPDGGSGSLKAFNSVPTAPSPVPLPASGLLLLGALGMLGWSRRKAA